MSAPSDLQSLWLVTGSVPSAQMNFHSFSVPLALLAPASRFQESQSKIEYDSSSAFCTVRIGGCGTRSVGINFCTVTEMSMNCSLVNLNGFSGRLGQLEPACATKISNLLNFCSNGHLVDSPGCSATVSHHLHLLDFGLHCVLVSPGRQ